MPRYDFECMECHKVFELDLSLTERESDCDKKSCIFCNSRKIKQVMTFGGVLSHGKSKSFDRPSCGHGQCSTTSCPYKK